MRVEGEDVVFDSSKVEKQDFGRGNDTMPLGWKAPGFPINKQVAFKMGWFACRVQNSRHCQDKNLTLMPKWLFD